MIINQMKTSKRSNYDIPGRCANCKKTVYENTYLLDDAYAVWLGKCPHCGALNFLDFTKGARGYSSAEMSLVLPTQEEKKENKLPEDCPTSDPASVSPET